MEKVVSEFIRLLKEKPKSGVKVFFMDYVSLSGLCEDEQAEVFKLWQDTPQLAEEILLEVTNVFARDKNSKLCEEILMKFIALWQDGSTSAGDFLQKYIKKRSLQNSVQLKLVDLWQDGSTSAGDFLLKYNDQCNLCEEVQKKFVDALPNSIAIKVLKKQRSYNKEILFNLLDAWKQYPDEVSIILEDANCMEKMVANEEVMLKLLDFMEEKPKEVKEFMKAYLQSEDLLCAEYSEILLKIIEHMEKGSAQAKELMVLCMQRPKLRDKDLCERIMKLFKANPAEMYDILLAVVKHSRADIVDTELVKLWQEGSQEAYNLLSNAKRIRPAVNTKLIELWQQGVSGAYELLKVQGKELSFDEEDQIKLIELMDKGSEEAYVLLSESFYYPGRRICSNALIKLLPSENPRAKMFIRKKMKQLEE